MNKISESIDCQVVQLQLIRCFLLGSSSIAWCDSRDEWRRREQIGPPSFFFFYEEELKKACREKARAKRTVGRNGEKKGPRATIGERRRRRENVVCDGRKKKKLGDTAWASWELFSLSLPIPFYSLSLALSLSRCILITEPNAVRGIERAIDEFHAHNEEIYWRKDRILIASINSTDFRLIRTRKEKRKNDTHK